MDKVVVFFSPVQVVGVRAQIKTWNSWLVFSFHLKDYTMQRNSNFFLVHGQNVLFINCMRLKKWKKPIFLFKLWFCDLVYVIF